MLTQVSVSSPALLKPLQGIDFPHKLGICERFFGRQLSKYGICWVNTGAGIRWKLDLNNPTHRWIVYGKYEGAPFLNWAKSFLPRQGIVVDSGANIGQMLLYLAQWVPEGKVLAFEPDNEAAAWLEECLTFHPALPVELIKTGLGNQYTQLFLKSVGAAYGHGAQNQVSETEGYPITIAPLAEELKMRGLDQVDLWVLDIEGYEVPALEGAESLLQSQQIKALYVELNGENGRDITDYLEKFGYCSYLFGSGGDLCLAKLDFSDSIHVNSLFLPR